MKFQGENKENVNIIDKEELVNLESASINVLDAFDFGYSAVIEDSTTLRPTRIKKHNFLEEHDEFYIDDNGLQCRVYYNRDGSYQIEKSKGNFKILNDCYIEQYTKDGKLFAKQEGKNTFYYDANENLVKKTESISSDVDNVIIYNKDGSVKAQSVQQRTLFSQKIKTQTKYFNDDNSYVFVSKSENLIIPTEDEIVEVQSFDSEGKTNSPIYDSLNEFYFNHETKKSKDINTILSDKNKEIIVDLFNNKQIDSTLEALRLDTIVKDEDKALNLTQEFKMA